MPLNSKSVTCIAGGNCCLRNVQISGVDDRSLNKGGNDMDILNFEAFLIAITILTLSSGLDTASMIRNTSRAGLADRCMTSFGICAGLYVHAFFSAVSISAIFAQLAELYQAAKMVAAVYLISLVLSSLRALMKNGGGLKVGEQTQKPTEPNVRYEKAFVYRFKSKDRSLLFGVFTSIC